MEVIVESHRIEVQNACKEAIEAALEAIGLQCEGYAKDNITAAGRVADDVMRGSITHEVVPDENAVYIGSDVEYAIYNEVGTGIYAEGGGGRKTPWAWRDKKGMWHTTVGMKPIHFLKRAVMDNIDEYIAIAEKHLSE